MKSHNYLIFTLTVLLFSCSALPKSTFEQQSVTPAPDYSNENNWAALPSRVDNADKTPVGYSDNQEKAVVDVFFLHPTIYLGKKEYDRWNAPIDLKILNDEVDNISILNQASAFNSAGRVFAPRYRQAHYNAYFTKDKQSAKKALDLAYEDVKEAFGYYLSHYNKGRPFIIASHSQGTTHASRLIEEFIDGKPLQKRLVAAYLIGIPVDMNRYNDIKACETADDTGCLIGWRTWKEGAEPKFLEKEKSANVLITNPLSWKTNTNKIDKALNLGTVINMEKEPVKNLVGAQIYKSILWVNKPKFPGSFFLISKNFHRGDINLFYINIRENAENRVSVFSKTK